MGKPKATEKVKLGEVLERDGVMACHGEEMRERVTGAFGGRRV